MHVNAAQDVRVRPDEIPLHRGNPELPGIAKELGEHAALVTVRDELM
jgi:hypothetical protein